jgi:hypothetical protein
MTKKNKDNASDEVLESSDKEVDANGYIYRKL